LTGLDGLTGSRNTSAVVSAGAVTAAAKDGSGSESRQLAGAFGAILLDVARPDAYGVRSSGIDEPRVSPERSSSPVRSAATSESSIAGLVDRFSGTGGHSHEGGATAPGDAREAEALAVREDAPEWRSEASRPSTSVRSAAASESSIAGLVDRFSGTGGHSHDRDATAPGDAREAKVLAVPDDAPGWHGEASRPIHAARGRLRASWSPVEQTTEASSDSSVSGPASSVGDQTGAASSLGTEAAMSASVAALSAASSVGPKPFAIGTDRSLQGPVEGGRSRVTRARASESALDSPTPPHPMPGPQDVRQLARGRSRDGTGDGGISRVSVPSDVAREPDFAVRIFDGSEDRPTLRDPGRDKLTVLAAETHFPPTGILSPADQIFHRVAAEVGAAIATVDPRRLRGSAGEASEPRDASATCIRSLTVLLETGSLAPVTIKLRLSGNSLGLEIEADDLETTRLIGRGRQALAEKLRALGLSVDTLVVSDAGRPRRRP